MRLKVFWEKCIWPLLSYLAVAVAASWPLVRHLSTHLTGPTGGDTGVYVWNTWVFRRELIEFGRQPYATDAIFWSGLPANLGLHNYTPFADLLAAFIQPAVGVVAAFNLVYLFNAALAGVGMSWLAAHHTRDRLAAWLAGAMFAVSPFLIARSLGHFSLAAAAPLPFFAWQLERVFARPTLLRGAGLGVIAGWAAMCDPYYVVYCAMLGAAYAATRFVSWSRVDWANERRVSAGDLIWGAVVLIVLALGLSGFQEGTIAGVRVTMRTLYTPALVLTLVAAWRLIRRARLHVTAWRAPRPGEWLAGAGLTAAMGFALSPWFAALLQRWHDGDLVAAPVMWRSSTPGVDLLALLVPNPAHPLMPSAVRALIDRGPGGYIEQEASLPLVALALIALAVWHRQRLSRWWIAVTIGCAWIALGPFVHIAGVNTYVPTPWALLRYVPLIDEARAPSRFAVVAVMGCAVLFAQAFAAWRARPLRRGPVALVALLLAFELLPAPRPLYSAEIPSIYRIVASDERPVSVLELPFGLRDGLSSLGNFTAANQFYQTYHRKPIFGGYLSRISDGRKSRYVRRPVLGALMALSERRALTPEQLERAKIGAADFVERTRLGYVVIDEERTSPELRAFAVQLFHLKSVAVSGMRRLYVPRQSGEQVSK